MWNVQAREHFFNVFFFLSPHWAAAVFDEVTPTMSYFITHSIFFFIFILEQELKAHTTKAN